MDKRSINNIREIQLILYDILCRLDEICKKHSITYYLTGGSALGAVRHGGFIPWDDDIDVVMPRPDYEKFCSLAQNELGNSFFWQTKNTDPNYHLIFGKIRKNNTYGEEIFNLSNLSHYGLFIDVFPLDGAPSYYLRKLNFGIPKYVNRLIFRKNAGYKLHSGILEELWMLLTRIIPFSILEAVQLKFINLYSFESSNYFVNLGGAYSYEKETAPKKWLTPAKFLKFEERYFPLMNKYDLFLQHLYGDYMTLPPENKRQPHYKKVEFYYDDNVDKN